MSAYSGARIQQALAAAGIPTDGISDINDTAHTARIVYSTNATSAQKTQGGAILAAFDWSAAADAAWLTTAERNNALATFLSDHSASAKVLRAVAYVLLDTVNMLEQQLQALRNDCRVVAPSIPAVTYAQYATTDLANAVQAKISSGVTD